MLKNMVMKAEMHIKFALLRRSTRRRIQARGIQNQNIILTGPARSGKSILSRMLEDQIGYTPFRMDSVGGYAKAYTNPTTRREKMAAVMKQVLTDSPNGLCLEGSTVLRGENYNFTEGKTGEKFFRSIARDGTLTELQKHEAFVKRHNEIDLADCMKIAQAHHAQIVLIGSLEDPQVKAEGMLAHRAAGKCWSSGYCTDDEVYYLALDNHICSKRLHELSLQYNILFVNVSSKSFEESLRTATEKLTTLTMLP